MYLRLGERKTFLAWLCSGFVLISGSGRKDPAVPIHVRSTEPRGVLLAFELRELLHRDLVAPEKRQKVAQRGTQISAWSA